MSVRAHFSAGCRVSGGKETYSKADLGLRITGLPSLQVWLTSKSSAKHNIVQLLTLVAHLHGRKRGTMMMHKYLQVSKVKRHGGAAERSQKSQTPVGSSMMHASFTIN